MPMPPAPRSPRPRIRSPSVRTTSFTFPPHASTKLAIGQDDELHVPAPRLDDRADAPAMRRRDPEALRTSRDLAPLLAGRADGRRVDERHHRFDVRLEQRVEEHRVPRLELCEPEITLERI